MLVDPAVPGRSGGNRVTALRWAAILRGLGVRVARLTRYDGRPASAVVALHAVRSAESIDRVHAERPDVPLLVAATGTDINDSAATARVARSLAAARAVLVLNQRALEQLPAGVRARAHVVEQSVVLPPEAPPPASGFQVCVLANLRAVKDPLLAAHAAALLPASSTVRVILLGHGLEPALAARARDLTQRATRFAWLGAVPRRTALRLLQGSGALVSSSISEGGSNAVGEAIVAGVPPLVTAIPGSLGLLGDDWPATFPVGDAPALAALMLRVERDARWRSDLQARLRALAPRFGRAREVERWRHLLRTVAPHCLAPEATLVPAT